MTHHLIHPVCRLAMVFMIIAQFCSCTRFRWHKLSEGDNREPEIAQMAFSDGSHGWATTFGSLLETNDGGRSWRYHEELVNMDFAAMAIEVVDPKRVWVGGSMGRQAAVLRIQDGRTGQPKSIPEMGERIYYLVFGGSGSLWAIGSNAVALSGDLGASWNVVLGPLVDHGARYGALLGRDGFTVVGDHGRLFISRDRGHSWVETQVTSGSRLTAVAFQGQQGVAVGFNGNLFTSSDWGATWQRAAASYEASFLDVKPFKDGWWVVGSDGTILHGTPDGKHWKRVPSPTQTDLACLYFRDDIGGWAGGDHATVLKLGWW